MKLLSILALTLISISDYGQLSGNRADLYNVKKGLALEGYDPVSFFDGKPTEGKSELKYVYKGITYQFSSNATLAKFKASPDKYEPAYGGWCAYAMGESGEKVKVDIETFKIAGGKLYLFYNFWGNNTLADWNKNETKLKTQADINWRKIEK